MDKEKALRFIEALQPHAGTTIKDEELSSAAKVVESFENPKTEAQNNSPIRFQKAGGGKRKADTRTLDGKIEQVNADSSLDEEKRANALSRLGHQKAFCESHLPQKSGLTLGFGKKKGTVNVSKFVGGKDDFEGRLSGIHYENGFAVASDGHTIIVITRQSYPRSYEGKTIRKDGTEADNRFPNWASMLEPNNRYNKARGEFDTADFVHALQKAADTPEDFKKAYLERYPDTSDRDVRDAVKRFSETPILDLPERAELLDGSKSVIGIDAEKAKQILNLIKETGGDVKITDNGTSIVVEGNSVYALFLGKKSSDWDGVYEGSISDDRRIGIYDFYFNNHDTRYSGKYQRYDQEQKKGPFGTIYEQFMGKAREAIAWLMQKKEGEAVDALYHKDVGFISLVWGNDKAGLKKILKKHPGVIDDLQGVLNGMHVVSASVNRIVLESETHRAVVSREFKGEPRENWLLTAYEKKETSEPAISSIDVEGNQGGKSDDTATRQSSEVSIGKDTQEPAEKQEKIASADKTDETPQADNDAEPRKEGATNENGDEGAAPVNEESASGSAPATEANSGGGGAQALPRAFR